MVSSRSLMVACVHKQQALTIEKQNGNGIPANKEFELKISLLCLML